MDKRNLGRFARAVTSALAVTGCSDLVQSAPLGNVPGEQRGGLTYSLPKGQVLVVARRSPADLAALNAAVADASKKYADASKAGTDSAATAAAKNALDAAQGSLDQLAPGGVATMQEVVTITALQPAPDSSARYAATFVHRPWRDDNLKLSVVNGLLNSSTLVSQDQTPAIAQAIATTVISLATGVPASGENKFDKFSIQTKVVEMSQPDGASPPIPPPHCIYAWAGVFDPAQHSELTRLNNSLHKARGDETLSIAVQYPSELPPLPNQYTTSTPKAAPGSAKDGLYYRVPTAVVVSAAYEPQAFQPGACRVATLPALTPVTVTVPDSRPGQEVNVSASAGVFTTSTIGLGFSNGMLTDWSLQRPSELLALANIPVALINQYTSIVTNFLLLRLNYATTDANIAAQKLNFLTSQVSQLQTAAQIAAASQTGDLKGQLAALQLQQQIKALQAQLAAMSN